MSAAANLVEINFDGIIGPSHNYAGLSAGNLASAANAGAVSHPRAAALQGIAKMRTLLDLGLHQGFLLPPPRPNRDWLAAMAVGENAASHLHACAMSASSMWAANAATVSPAPDTHDGRCHLTVANLQTMPHRAHEWRATLAQLRTTFAHASFAVHPPVPAPFGDEGAANHMRLCADHASAGVEIFVYGTPGGHFLARQHVEASRAVARHNRVKDALFVAQSDAALAAGAFHNDVVAVANEDVLFVHEEAFAGRDMFYAALHERFPALRLVEVPTQAVTLAAAIESYLFNAQLVTLPTRERALIVPVEAVEHARVGAWLTQLAAANGPITRVVPVDVRESMANGGGPACLRLRVVADPAHVDPRFMADHARLDQIAAVVARHWPAAIAPAELANPALIADVERAHAALLAALDCRPF